MTEATARKRPQGDLPSGCWSWPELPDMQRDFLDRMVRFAGPAGAAPRPDVLLDEQTEAARSALLADSEQGRWSCILNVQLLGLLAWARGLHTGDVEELALAADWLTMVLRCGPGALPEPLRSAGSERFTAAGLAALAADTGGADRSLGEVAEFVRAGLGWAATPEEAQAVTAYARARALARQEEQDNAAAAESALQAVTLLPTGHWLRPTVLSQAARSLGGAAWDSGVLGDAEALRHAQEAFETAPPGHPHLAGYLAHVQLLRAAPLTPRLEDLPVDECREAVALGRRAIDLTEADDPGRPDRLLYHVSALELLLRCDPYDRAVRDEMLRCGRLAARLRRGSALQETDAWATLGNAVQVNYLLTGELEVLRELIGILREADRTAPPGSAPQAEVALRLARAEHVLAARQADVAALNAAAERYRAVADTLGLPVPEDSPAEALNRATARNEAAAGLQELLETRAQLLSDRESRVEALNTLPPEVELPPTGSGNLGDLMARSQFALSRLQQATATFVANTAQARDEGNAQDIRAAGETYRQQAHALAAEVPYWPPLADGVDQLIAVQLRIADSLESGEPLPRAELLDDLPADELPGRAPFRDDPGTGGKPPADRGEGTFGLDLHRLVRRHFQAHEVARFRIGAAQHEAVGAFTAKQHGEPHTVAWSRALAHTQRVVADPAASPVDLLPHARLISLVAAELDDLPAAASVLAAAVRATGTLASFRLRRAERETMLARYANGLGDEACAAALLAGEPAERALTLLESGRGLLAATRLGSMTELGTLRRRFPQAAADFEAAAAELEAAQEPLVQDRPEALERRHRATDRWEAQLARIRALPGQQAFLEPLSGARLRALADRGPLVSLTLHPRRSHALLVTAEDVEALRLPDASPERARQWTARLEAAARALDPTRAEATAGREVRAVLTELWHAVAEPVLDALGHNRRPASPADRPRIWWVPSGPAAFLPLHAAGCFTEPPAGSGAVAEQLPDENVLDRVVSSYAPTLRALRHARLRPAHTGSASVLAVAAPGEPGTVQYLAMADDEAQDVRDAVGAGRYLAYEEATAERVRQAMGDHTWLHFAGHAAAPPDGSGSGASGVLALNDGLLSPESVDRLSLPAAGLAYLSGCGTARGTAALADESLHVAAALHLAGYRDVVGTLWPVRDEPAALTALDFYRHLRTGAGPAPAAALDAAVRTARLRAPDRPELWAAHVHIGP